MKSRETGFSFIEVTLVVAFVAVFGFVVVTAVNNHSNVASEVTTQATVAPAPQVTSAADLVTAEQSLDTTAIDDNSNDANSLDQDLATF
jgi:competence protein ComGC